MTRAPREKIPIFNFQIPNKLQLSKSKILKFFYLELENYLEFACLPVGRVLGAWNFLVRSTNLPPTLNSSKILPNTKLQ